MNLYQRLAAAMKHCTYVRKDTKVSGFGGGYSAVSHDAVTAKVRGALIANGIIAHTSIVSVERSREEIQGKNGTRTVFRSSVTAVTTFVNIDEPSEKLEVHSIGTGEDSGDKADGKAVSYAAKYALLKALMLETGDDADKDASIPRTPAKPAPKKAMVERFNHACKGIKMELGEEEGTALIEATKAKHKQGSDAIVTDLEAEAVRVSPDFRFLETEQC